MNGVLAILSSNADSNQRSGRKTSASGPQRSARLCASNEAIIICVLGGRYRLLVLGMTSGSSREVRPMSGADGKMRRTSLRTACTVVYRELNKSGMWESNVKRTIVHLFEVRVGRGACRPKRVEDFLPQTTANVPVHRKEVYHE